jgi:hypothetical protein
MEFFRIAGLVVLGLIFGGFFLYLVQTSLGSGTTMLTLSSLLIVLAIGAAVVLKQLFGRKQKRHTSRDDASE